MIDIINNLKKIHNKITQSDSGQRVQLVAVSKTQSVQTIKQAHQAGQRHFGENYLQEALPKIKVLQDCEIIWHFIGAVQSNKTREVAQNFSWVHSIERFKIARRLSEQRPHNLSVLNICLQVNIDNSPTKSGVSVAVLPDLIKEVQVLPRIRLRGLMCMPDPQNVQNSFKKIQQLFKQYPTFDTLSMGTSADIDLALKYGTTMLRVGQGIFGVRKNSA